MHSKCKCTGEPVNAGWRSIARTPCRPDAKVVGQKGVADFLQTGLAVAMFVLFKMLKNGTHGTTSRKTLYSSGGCCQRYFHHHVIALAGACGHDHKHDLHAQELSVMNVSCSV